MSDTPVKNINIPIENRSINLEQGKLPPQALDLEKAILGGIMVDKSGLAEVIDLLKPATFYHQAHQKIFEAILGLFEDGEAIDILTVGNRLKKNGTLQIAGGDFYLVKLTQTVASSAHILHHARIIIQKYIKRSLIAVAAEMTTESYKDGVDVFDLLDKVETDIFDISQGNLKKGAETSKDLVAQAMEKIKGLAHQKGMSGLETGFEKLDEMTSGWQSSDLVIIAARPGMGKTAFVLSMSLNMAIDFNYPVALFSLEMSSVQLITRMISNQTQLDSTKLRTGDLESYEWEQLNTKVTALSEAPIYIDDTPSISIFDLRAKARRLKSQHDVKIIIIDYLQLMTAGGNNKGNREQEISTISRNLKALAKELDIPVVALSQLSRAVEVREGDKRPLLSDLRESGAIEQDADIVSFLYRPEYYKIDEWDDKDNSPTKGEAELIIAKHRNGGLGNVRLRFVGQITKFDNLKPVETTYKSKVNANMPKGNPSTAFADETPKSIGENSEGLPF